MTSRHLFVTGGTRGIGYAVVTAAASRGDRVSFVARNPLTVGALAQELQDRGVKAVGCCADVTHEAEVRKAVAVAEQRLGLIDVLVNNAGRTTVHGPLQQSVIDEWWTDVSVNLLGVAVTTAAVLPSMSARRTGRIINMVSGTAGRASPHNTAYACSKAAVVRLTDSLAEEVRGDGITVFALRPGNVATDMTAEFAASASARRWLAPELAQLKPQRPDRAVAATLWLADGHGDALTGRWLDADDDLEYLVRQAKQITTEDLDQLRRRRLPADDTSPRSGTQR